MSECREYDVVRHSTAGQGAVRLHTHKSISIVHGSGSSSFCPTQAYGCMVQPTTVLNKVEAWLAVSAIKRNYTHTAGGSPANWANHPRIIMVLLALRP